MSTGAAVAIHIDDERSSSTNRRSSPYAMPPQLHRRRFDQSVCMSICTALVFYATGLVLSVVVFALLLVILPCLLPVRLIVIVYSRMVGADGAGRLCDPWWPLQDADYCCKAVITVQRALSSSDVVAQILGKRLLVHDTNRVYERRRNANGRGCCENYWRRDLHFDVRQHVTDWNNGPWSQRRLDSIRDLQQLLNESSLPFDDAKPPWNVVLVPTFGDIKVGGVKPKRTQLGVCCDVLVEFRLEMLLLQNGTECSLALVDVHCALCTHLCMLRLVSVWTDGNLCFEIEPKFCISPPFIVQPITGAVYSVLTACHTVYSAMQLVCVGPLALLISALRPVDPIWMHVRAGGAPSVGVVTNNRYRPTSTSTKTSESTQMVEDETISHRCRRRVSWMRIANADQIFRAERILRAATVELMLAFVAGALRRHFRSQGIQHPSDITVAMPISCRDCTPIDAHRPCQILLLPLKIPTSIEGNIPRLWAVQRRLTDAFDSAFPNAFRAARVLGDLMMPHSCYRHLLSTVYGSTSIIVSYVRASGSLEVDQQKLQSILIYPSLPDHVQAAFTFIQCGAEMMLSLSVDARTFPDPDRLLINFKSESQSLLNQLSMRLLTLSQATFLPVRMPITLSTTITHTIPSGHPCRSHDDNSTIADNSRSVPMLNEQQSDTDNELKIGNLDELESLLAAVQSELDTMRDNPQGDRGEYILKLTELERKMESFHRIMADRLGPAAMQVYEDAELASNAVSALLAPYRDEMAVPGQRRFSREFMRRDSQATTQTQKIPKQQQRQSPNRCSSSGGGGDTDTSL